MRRSAIIVGCITGLVVPSVVHAQSSVGEPNSVAAGIAYAYGKSTKIVETDGIEIPNIDTTHHVIAFSASYVTPLKGLAVEAELPFVGVKWDDSTLAHFPEPGEYDDGDLHWTATDLRGGLRYQLLQEPLELAVAVGGTIPVADYPTVGYTAPGRHLKALHLGLAVSRFLDPIAPRLYVSAEYEFTLSEKYDEVPETKEYGQNRSDLSLQVGYVILDNLEAHVAFDARKTHGGIDFTEFSTLPGPVQVNHDAVLREDVYLLGGGLGYLVTDALALGFEARFFVAGANTRNANIFSLLASYAFN